jgi:ankyrin repeat protein
MIDEIISKIRFRFNQDLQASITMNDLESFVPLLCSSSNSLRKNAELAELVSMVEKFLEDERYRVLLLYGNSGSGKTLFGRYVQNLLWEKPHDLNIFMPIFVDMSTSEDALRDLIEKSFLQNGLSKQDVEILKASQLGRFLFIFDGFHAISSSIIPNLFEQTISSWPNSKVLITARTDVLLSLGLSNCKRYFTLKDDDEYLEYYIRPFSIDQRQLYFQKVFGKDNVNTKWELVVNALEETRVIGVSSILNNPFTLRLIGEYLQAVFLEPTMSMHSKMTRATIYTHYVENTISKASLIWKQECSDMTFPMNYDQYSFIGLKILAMVVAGNMFIKNSQFIDSFQTQFHIPENSLQALPSEEWKAFVLDMKIAFVFTERVSLIFKRVGNGLIFQHPCLYEYFTAKVLFEELFVVSKDESLVSRLPETAFFNQQSLRKQASILQILFEMIEYELAVQSAAIIHTLWRIIDQSKNTPAFAIAAGNAFTLLVLFKVSFKQHNLSNIWVYGATLDGHIFEEVNFIDAHFTATSWNSVHLHHCDFTNCTFQENHFQERATLKSPVLGSIYRIQVLSKYHIVVGSGYYPGFVVWQYGQRIYSNRELHGCEMIISPNQLWIACKLQEHIWLYSVKNQTIVHEITDVHNLAQVRNNGLIYYKQDKAYFLYYKERVKDPRKIYKHFDDTPEIAELELELNKDLKELAFCVDLKDGLKACLYKDYLGWSIVGTFSLTINHGKKNFFSLYEDPENKKNKLTFGNMKTFNYIMISGISQTPFFLVTNSASIINGFDARTLQTLPNLEHLSNYPVDNFIVSPNGNFLLTKRKKTVHVFSVISNENSTTSPVSIKYLYTKEDIRNDITMQQFSADEKYIVWGLVGQVIVTNIIENTIVQEVFLREKTRPVIMVAFLMTPEYNEEDKLVNKDNHDQRALGNATEAQLIVLQDIDTEIIRLKVDIDEEYEDKVVKQRIKDSNEIQFQSAVQETVSSTIAAAVTTMSPVEIESTDMQKPVALQKQLLLGQEESETAMKTNFFSFEKNQESILNNAEIRAMGTIFIGAQFVDQDGSINQEDIRLLKERGGIFDDESILITKYKASTDKQEKEDLILLAASYRYRQFFESEDVVWEKSTAFERNNHDTLIHFIVRQERNDGDYEDYLRLLIHTIKIPFDAGNTHLMSPLYIAARKGHVKTCTVLVEANANVNQPAFRGYTPLYVAALEGYVQVCKLLLDAQAEVDRHSDDGYFPLYIAAKEGREDVCRLLIQYGANITKADNDGFTPMYLACQHGCDNVLRVLIDEGHADVNQCSNEGMPPLYIATQNGHIETMRILIQSGAQVNLASKDGSTPILTATQHVQIEATRLLIEHGANVNTADVDGFSPLYLAAFTNGHDQICRMLVEAGANPDQPNKDQVAPLYAASENGHQAICKYLLEQGADVNRPTTTGCTPLYIAAYVGHTEIVQLFLTSETTEVKQANNEGYSPLYAASRNGHESIVDMLIEHGANVLQEDHEGNSPLYIASMHGHASICTKLINKGGEVGKIDQNGFFPIYVSAQNGQTEVCRILLQHGADPNQLSGEGFPGLYVASQNGHYGVCEALLNAGANANFAVNGNFTSFYIAAKYGFLDVCKLLVAYKADFNVVTDSGYTPLYIAADNNRLEVCKYLVELGVNVNLADHDGFFPLYIAAEAGFDDVCRVLLDGGADVHFPLQNSFPALYIAAQRGHGKVCTLLLDYGANIHHSTIGGFCSLYIASDFLHEETCRILIDRMNCIPSNCLRIATTRFGETHEIVKLMQETNEVSNPHFSTYII